MIAIYKRQQVKIYWPNMYRDPLSGYPKLLKKLINMPKNCNAPFPCLLQKIDIAEEEKLNLVVDENELNEIINPLWLLQTKQH